MSHALPIGANTMSSAMPDAVNAHLVDRGIEVVLDDAAYAWLIETTCADRSYGARPLRRAIQKHVEDALAEELIRGNVRHGVRVDVTTDGDGLRLMVHDVSSEPEPAETVV